MQSFPYLPLDGPCPVLGIHHSDSWKTMPSGGLHHKQRGPEKKPRGFTMTSQPRSDLPQWTMKSIVSVATANIYLRRKQKKRQKKKTTKRKKPCIAHRREKSCRSNYSLVRHCTLQVKKTAPLGATTCTWIKVNDQRWPLWYYLGCNSFEIICTSEELVQSPNWRLFHTTIFICLIPRLSVLC